MNLELSDISCPSSSKYAGFLPPLATVFVREILIRCWKIIFQKFQKKKKFELGIVDFWKIAHLENSIDQNLRKYMSRKFCFYTYHHHSVANSLKLIWKQDKVFSKRRPDFICKVSLKITERFSGLFWVNQVSLKSDGRTQRSIQPVKVDGGRIEAFRLGRPDMNFILFSFVFNVFDDNGDGFIEFDEFLQAEFQNWPSMTSNEP